MNKKILSFLLLAIMTIVSCTKTTSAADPVSKHSSETILFWNEVAFHAFGGFTYLDCLSASRLNAMVHLAIHDALNGIEGKYGRYAFSGVDEKADPIAAASSAAHTVLLKELPAKEGFLDSALAQALITVKDEESKSRGLILGKNAALAIIALRQDDNSTGELFVPVAPSSQPGVYQATPPFNINFAPHWENVKLFSLSKKDQFRSAPYPALNSAAYHAGFAEVKATGKLNSNDRSAEQSSYAKFWFEFSEAGWNRIAREAVKSKKLNMLDAARLFALVDIALADAYIAGWDSKLYYNFWRPYTAIRNAAADGNDATVADANWEPAEPTPPVPDYPSTHSALGNAASTVLARILGDNTTFTFSSPTALPAGSSRTFQSFSQASNENADSRVRAGIHFRFSCEAGQELGNKIGNWTVDHHLKPIVK